MHASEARTPRSMYRSTGSAMEAVKASTADVKLDALMRKVEHDAQRGRSR